MKNCLAVIGAFACIVAILLAAALYGSRSSTGLPLRIDSHPIPSRYIPTLPTLRTVTYAVHGGSNTYSVTYKNKDGNTEQIESVPRGWKYEFRTRYFDFMYISAQNNSNSSYVQCEILIDGVVIEDAKSEGAYRIATCSH